MTAHSVNLRVAGPNLSFEFLEDAAGHNMGQKLLQYGGQTLNRLAGGPGGCAYATTGSPRA